MTRSSFLLTLLLAAPAAAAPVSDLKDPFRPAANATPPASAPASDLRDPFTTGESAGGSTSELRDPWAHAPTVQRPATTDPSAPRSANHDLKDPWSSPAVSKPRRGKARSGELRDPFAPAVQRPHRPR